MKKLLLITSLSAIANMGIGQTITSNDLQIPGKAYKLGVNTSAALGISIGGKGAGQNWDYSKLAQEAFDTVGTLIPYTTAYGALFPNTSNATITSDNDGKTFTYYTVSSSKVEASGVAYESLTLEGKPKVVLKTIKPVNYYETLPIKLGNKTFSKGTYLGKVKYSAYLGVDSLEMTMVIEKADTADASGSIKIPTGNSYNVVRLKTYVKRTITVRLYVALLGSWTTPPSPYNVPNVEEEVYYSFWAEGIGNEVCKVSFDGIKATSPFNVKWYLNSATGLNDDQVNLQNIFISPNPATSQIKINGYTGAINLSIHSLQGENVLNKISINNDQLIDVSNLNAGIYMATVETSNGSKVKTKFVIQ